MLNRQGHGEHVHEEVDLFASEVSFPFFPSAEHHFDLYLVPFFKEVFGFSCFSLKVSSAGVEVEANRFEFDFFLMCFLLSFRLGLLVSKCTIVEDAGDRGNCERRDFDEVEISFDREAEGLFFRQDAELIILLVDDAEFAGSDLVVGAEIFSTNGSPLT